LAEKTILYDWAHPVQQAFERLTKYLKRRADIAKRFREYHTRLCMELAQQRRAIKDQLHSALGRNCLSPYTFGRWQRAIRWEYASHPLCTVGSLISGGRFNIGRDIEPLMFPPFPAFYVAKDKETALQEAFGQDSTKGMTALDLALARPESVLVFSVSGSLDQVLDLRVPGCLKEFVDLIKDFKVSPGLEKEARSLPVRPASVIKTTKQLQDSLLTPNWRQSTTLCEIPANSQFFGQLAMSAGIEGILYPSKLTGKDCLAIFPNNFLGGSSHFELDDAPPTLVGPSRIDHRNLEASARTADQLRGSPLQS
jgi:hypothetical protein